MHLDEGNRTPLRGGRKAPTAKEGLSLSSVEGAALLRGLASPVEEEARVALGRWKDLLEPNLVLMVWKLTNSEADAEEIVTDAFQRLWKHRGRFAEAADRGYNNPWCWLWEVAKKLVTDRYRRRNADKRGRNPEQVFLDDATVPSGSPERSYLQTIGCDRFREALSPVERFIWDMRLEGNSVKSISAALRGTASPLTPKQVRSRLEMMRERFASLFGLGSS
jgi:DNA-directed RNA polymerase specialized sigma24 family protein